MAYDKLSLGGRTAVVVGGTSGIGLAIAKGLAQAEANVVATGRRKELVNRVADEIRAVGVRSAAIASDVAQRESLQELLTAVIADFGAVDILVYAAGKTKRTPVLQLPESEWADIMDTNLTGALRACQVFVPHMIERKYGRIITVASLTSFIGMHEVAAYSVSKAGLAMLTKCMAIEWSQHGICVNAIAPGV